ncbi:MAG: GNAT family N-acetyltransferase [Oscillospiraceae bacterium]|jgi:ribosomal protein S18 acetylase RimI-like enzyme|nr:GNAT family N-acetyltransferase [Oscillospiraceae bacterium]
MNFHKIVVSELTKLAELFTAFDNDAFIAQRRREIESGETAIFALEQNGRIMAEITVRYYDTDGYTDFSERGKRAYLYALRVLPEYQGHGLAQSLTMQVLAELRKSGYSEATIGVEDDNDRAKHIYRKLGFTTLVKRCRETFQVDTYEFNLYLNDDI